MRFPVALRHHVFYIGHMPTPFNLQGSGDSSGLTLNDVLRREDYDALASASVDGFQLRGRLWELIYALAGKLVFIRYSDHLNDRELYRQLTELVLPLPASLLSLEPGHPLFLRMYEADPAQATRIWLRFYADSQTLERWAYEFPTYELPPAQRPPFARDHWLPSPSWRSYGQVQETPSEPEPTHASREQQELEELPDLDATFDPVFPDSAESYPLEDPEEFASPWSEEWRLAMDQIQKEHGTLIPPAELTEETLTPALWELLHNLATHGFFVVHTDHLSDLEFYTQLGFQGLRRKTIPASGYHRSGWCHDLIGGGTDEDTSLWLRYYASDEERECFRREFPNTDLPPREKPKAHRDWRLPRTCL